MKRELILSKATETLEASVSLTKLYSFFACCFAVPTPKTYSIQGYISENITNCRQYCFGLLGLSENIQ